MKYIKLILKDLKVCDDGTLIQILYFWTLSIVLLYLKHTTFQRLDSVAVFRWNLLSRAQSIELVRISGHLRQFQDGVYKPKTALTICES
jgi:hypothetical protein